MEERDVIVVGAGPAGASCAKALRDAGVDVLVLEKEPLPRYKCCSGVLFGQTQELLERYFGAQAPAAVRCAVETIEACDVQEWQAREGFRRYAWEIDKDGRRFPERYINVWRNLFDQWLLDRSRAEYGDRALLKAMEAATDSVSVYVEHGGRRTAGQELRRYRCRYLVGADGGQSSVRRLLGPQSTPWADERTVAILQSYFVLESLGTLKRGSWSVFFLTEIGEMLSCVHQKGDYLLLCVGGFRGRKLRQSIDKLYRFLAEQFGVRLGDRWREEACQMQLGTSSLGRGRVLLTGEAADFVYLNGEGISAAIDSGYRCGQAIGRALQENKDAMPIYAEDCRDIAAHVEECLGQIRFLVSQAT